MSRRSDNGLRDAITSLEQMLLTKPSVDMFLTKCLKELMVLIGSDYGYVYKCGSTEGSQIPWQLNTCYCMKHGLFEECPSTSTSTQIPEELKPTLLAGRSVTHHGPMQSDTLPHQHPEIRNAFCLPLTDANNIYAVIYLCNTFTDIDTQLESRLRPFVAAAICVLRALNSDSRLRQKNPETSLTEQKPGDLLGLIDSLFNGVILVSQSDLITMCNLSAASLFGVPRRDIIGQKLSQYISKGITKLDTRFQTDTQTDTQTNTKTAVQTGTQTNAQISKKSNSSPSVWRGVPIINASNEKRLVDLRSIELVHAGERVRGFVIEDISERLKSASEYQTTLQRYQALTNIVPVAIIQLNRNWECSCANDTWCEYCQMTPDEAQGIGWLKGLYTNDADSLLNTLRSETAKHGRYEGECRLQSPLGGITWVKANASCLYSESGEVSGMIMTFNDITDRLNNERRLQDIAEKDQLTGLINRAFFNDRLETALRGVERFGAVALLFIDLDEFKHINDTIGHDAGDLLLTEVANRLRDSLRQVDTIARIGGDEFTVILTNVQNTRAITAIAEKLLLAMNDPIMLGERAVYATCSVGIAVAETDHIDSKTLLKQADAALYKAKEAGRNQYKFHTPELDKDANIHIMLRESLKQPKRQDFYLVYQPQVNASTGQITGVEALARWQRDDVDPIGPNIFIKIIEESGLIEDFSTWLLEEVFGAVSQWSKFAHFDLQVSVNISAKQFRDKDLAMLIHHRCRAHGVDPQCITLEITETALIDDPKIAAETLKKLQRMGFHIALDDFGTGYSSLMYLRSMPLECVKIDRSFIKDIVHDEGDAKIVSAILALAKTLELEVVAEGVDNTDVMQWLLEHDCDIQQGFHFHKPLPKNKIETLLGFKSTSEKVIPFSKGLS